MRRILQFSTLVLILTVIVTPISEAFDHWDPPGLGHDTEFAVFAFVLSLVFVLLVSKLVASLRQIILLLPCLDQLFPNDEPSPSLVVLRISCLSPDTSPPLRI